MDNHQKDLFELGQLHGEIEAAARSLELETDPFVRTLLNVLDTIGHGANTRGVLVTATTAWKGEE